MWRYPTILHSSLAAAELIRLQEGHTSLGHVHQYLGKHPSLVWLLGFPLHPAPHHPVGFNGQASLPTARHLVQMFRDLPNAVLQDLLADSVQLIWAGLVMRGAPCVTCVSLPTKQLLAWV